MSCSKQDVIVGLYDNERKMNKVAGINGGYVIFCKREMVICISKQTLHNEPMLALYQHCFNVSCLLG